jgi:hypothetical protein
MVKSSKRVIDLSCVTRTHTTLKSLLTESHQAQRMPPLTPQEFEERVTSKTFTNGHADIPLTTKLYEASFAAHFGRARELAYHSLKWGDAEGRAVATMLASGACASLTNIFMTDNQMGDDGAHALAAVLADSRLLPRIERVTLSKNPIGPEGAAALRAAVHDRPRIVLVLTAEDAARHPDPRFNEKERRGGQGGDGEKPRRARRV